MAKTQRLPVPALTGEKLIKQGFVQRYTHLGMFVGTLSLTNQRVILRDGFIWILLRRTRVFELSNVTVGDDGIPWYLKPNEWLGGVWWLETRGKKFHFTPAWFQRWIQDIRKAKDSLEK